MDAYLITPARRIDDGDAMSFHGRMQREFYDRMLEELDGPDICFGYQRGDLAGMPE